MKLLSLVKQGLVLGVRAFGIADKSSRRSGPARCIARLVDRLEELMSVFVNGIYATVEPRDDFTGFEVNPGRSPSRASVDLSILYDVPRTIVQFHEIAAFDNWPELISLGAAAEADGAG